MTPTERDRIMLRVQAVWPKPIGDAAAMVWSEHLTKMDYTQAAKGIALLERSKTHQPSIAELWDAYRAAQPPPAVPELEQPVDKDAALRARELVAAATKPGRPITATMLDKAGVLNWRKRIEHALERDFVEMRNRVHYDEAWDAIRAEFVNANRATA